MFTGLIEEVGRLTSVQPKPGGGARIRVTAKVVLQDLSMGDSIAVNGTCLTAVEWTSEWVEFDAVEETLRLTTLTGISPGAPVNLERALQVGSRVGGHYVTGHIDGRGSLASRNAQGNGVVYRFETSKDLLSFITPKGSIAVDGISLTVVDVAADTFSVWIVPHTEKSTNLSTLKIGDSINLETDILAKYVARMVCDTERVGTVSMNKLQEAGF